MKKYILTYLILCVYTTFSVAQNDDYIPFLEEGVAKKWTMIGHDYTDIITIYQCASQTDTIINGLAYRTLTSVFEPNIFMGVREENKKVYVFVNYSNSGTDPFSLCQYGFEQQYIEVLIYDFNLKIGDIFEVDSCRILSSQDNAYKVIKEEKILLNGIERRKWTLRWTNITHEIQGEHGEEWIEGIGSTNGFFPDAIAGSIIHGVPTFSLLACVQEGGYLVYDGGSFDYDCLRGEHEQPPEVTNVATPSQTNTFAFQAFPNIFAQTTTLQFVLPETTITSLHIYNSQGQKIQTIFSNEMLPEGQHQPQLQLTNVAEGIYYAVLSLNGTTVKVHKMMYIN